MKKNQDFSFRNWLLNPVNKINLIECRFRIQNNENLLIKYQNYSMMKMGQITHCESDTATNGSNNNTTTTIVCDRLPEPTEFANGNPFLMVWFIRFFHQSGIPKLRIFSNIFIISFSSLNTLFYESQIFCLFTF